MFQTKFVEKIKTDILG